MKLDDLSLKERATVSMKRRHIPLWAVASQMNLSPTAVYNRLSGIVPFKQGEREMLCRLLKIADTHNECTQRGGQ
jgi:hypothetical protein